MTSTMKSLNCESYQLTVFFDEKNFKVEDFKKEVGAEDNTDGVLVFNFNSKNRRKKEHAHLQIEFDKEESILRASFHPSRLDDDDDDLSELRAEHFLKELSQFFIDDDLDMLSIVRFRFNKKFESIIALNYPFLLGAKYFQGAEITGYEMKFPEGSPFLRILISSDREIRLVIQRRATIKLSEFNHYSEIEQFIPLTKELVREKGANNDRDTEK